MQPNNTNNQPITPNNPATAPQPIQTPVVQQPPVAQAQPETVQQPAQTAHVQSGIQPQTPANLKSQAIIALWLSIASIAVFVVALIFGYILWIAALMGAYGLAIGIRTKSTSVIVLGSIGLFLNGVGYFVLPALFPVA